MSKEILDRMAAGVAAMPDERGDASKREADAREAVERLEGEITTMREDLAYAIERLENAKRVLAGAAAELEGC